MSRQCREGHRRLEVIHGWSTAREAETDWLYGRFIDTGTGMLGRWSDGGLNEFGTHDSLAEYFHFLVDAMREHGKAEDGRLVW
ncbi:hypothetical protein C1I97_34135 [Streptomyces sp. NTH33]|nr:hypothetical protein C1I97_34135 [Streptomyces sp. NTH33]